MRWDSIDRRYEDSKGRALTPAKIRKHITDFVESEKEHVRAESTRLFAREITVSEFFTFMRQRVTAWHGTAGVIAYGGEAQMNAARWKRINEKILSELEYLNDFEEAVENSFAAADAIGEQAVQSIAVPLGMESLVRSSVADALLQAAPSDAEAGVRRTIIEVLQGATEAKEES